MLSRRRGALLKQLHGLIDQVNPEKIKDPDNTKKLKERSKKTKWKNLKSKVKSEKKESKYKLVKSKMKVEEKIKPKEKKDDGEKK